MQPARTTRFGGRTHDNEWRVKRLDRPRAAESNASGQQGIGGIVIVKLIGKLSVASSVTVLLALPAWGEAAGEKLLERGAAQTVQLRKGESFPIDPLKLTSGTLFDITPGEKRILLRATPDGFMQFVQTTARAKVTVRGRRKNTVSFELQAGELVSVWPVSKVKL
ncbi:unnamed protein product, partial [marine sediment metagenome]